MSDLPRTLEATMERALTIGLCGSAVLLLGGLLADSSLLLRAGTLLLMLTPVARVVLMTWGLFALGDRRFGSVSLFVLAVLAVGMVMALREAGAR